jgi:hypothetical protein
MDQNHLQNPWAFYQDGHRFNGLPLEIVGQIGADGSSGIQVYFNHFYLWEGPAVNIANASTSHSITDPADAPLDADALRDDLVANAIPDIENALNALGTKINNILAAPPNAAAGWYLDGSQNGEACDVLDSVQYGAIRLITGSTDNNFAQLRQNGSPWRYVAGKRLWFFVRFRMQDVNDGEVFFGLALEGDTNFLSTLPTDGIFFEKAEAATDFDLHAHKNGVSTEKAAVCGAALADTTWYELGFVVNSGGDIIPYYNGTKKTSKIISAGDANIPNDEDLAVYFGVQTGAAATRYLDVDWLLVAQER